MGEQEFTLKNGSTIRIIGGQEDGTLQGLEVKSAGYDVAFAYYQERERVRNFKILIVLIASCVVAIMCLIGIIGEIK
jgi:hypothetical protein